ncbi:MULTISPECIES: hypothetical protein [Hydrocarboniphaga]|jgi:hypothetical protein|uniref:Copper resistance protein D domain-containing protein n=1 Tax=Hydrocarboniphaga effusa AP103 TaxID=1172194 RepID=I8T264_9GAMM|nr:MULTISPECIES: hypothetical protein [Hydrocarboniphaga]EIT67773.1 hypothetical protein WQQ_42080 [Hydrocarboniphaga effusa AP103]MDZ4079822.1 hypothetical protein [Hydrocarboniphaga sp.]
MIMTSNIRKLMLTFHVTASIGWAGALAVFLAHSLVSLSNQDPAVVRAACLMMGITAWFVILPLAATSLVTGLVQALGTAWGLFRHYWVTIKLLLTAFATAVLLLKLTPISALAAAAQTAVSLQEFAGLKLSLVIHAAGGLGVLLVTTALAIYKPAGLTPYGARMLGTRSAYIRNSGSAAGLPRWVKGFVAASMVLLLVLIVMIMHGGHGPGAHM